MKYRLGFTVVEIVIALVIIAVGFLPIYNLFRQGSVGTVNTINETEATNYASDLINLCKDLRYSSVTDKVSGNERKLENDILTQRNEALEKRCEELNEITKNKEKISKRIKINNRKIRKGIISLNENRKQIIS